MRENVGGGWGEATERDVMTDYQKKRLGCDPRPCSEDLLRRALKERVLTAVRRQVEKIDGGCRARGA